MDIIDRTINQNVQVEENVDVDVRSKSHICLKPYSVSQEKKVLKQLCTIVDLWGECSSDQWIPFTKGQRIIEWHMDIVDKTIKLNFHV